MLPRYWRNVQDEERLVLTHTHTPPFGTLVIEVNNTLFYLLRYFERSKKIAGSTLGSQEKDVWRLILNNQLDDIAVAVGERRRERMEKFASDLFLAIDRSAKKIQVSIYSQHLPWICILTLPCLGCGG